MCGIVGGRGSGAAVPRAVIDELNKAQEHRGPDHAVVVEEGLFTLGNTRLAIQDPRPEGNQPFRDPDGLVTVVFNGEIYNFHELVREHGLDVRTGCDGEIIPLLWLRLGPRCLRLFRGMFAVAVADHRDGRLYLARDPFGIKPLRWRHYGGGVLFASEAKPLWRVDRSMGLSQEALGHYLRYGSFAADGSPFEGLHSVAPGACISFGDDGSPRDEDLVPAIDPDRADAGTLADAFRSSVRMHLVSDVPTALLLSAGIDSTLIGVAAQELGVSLHCLTVRGPFGEDESAQAAATTRELGHSHEVVPATLEEGTVHAFFEAMQRPTIDGFNSYLVNAAVRRAGFKVALSGLGGDEALGGYAYTRYIQALPVLAAADRVPASVSRPVRDRLAGRLDSGSGKAGRLLAPTGPRRAGALVELQRELFSESTTRRLLGTEVSLPTPLPPGNGTFDEIARAELVRYLGPMLLPDADAFSMAWSVELRVPFVDVPFFARAVGREHLRGKLELVEQMDNRYLSLLARRRKTGFSVPMLEWIRSGPLRTVVLQALSPSAPVWDVLDPQIGRSILAESTSTERWSGPWAIAALDGWLRSL